MRLSWREAGSRTVLVVEATGAETVPQDGDWAVVPESLLPEGLSGLVPMAGEWRFTGSAHAFEPRFPFLAGVSYAVVLDGRPVGALRRPAPAVQPSTRVVALYPAVAEVPLNLLRLYLQFSAPMREGCALRHVHLTDAATGVRRDGAFLDMTPELWDASRTCLTLLLDPGRIKRGLVPHDEAGYPLEGGRTTLVTIDAAWPDAHGQPLAEGVSRTYDVGPAVRAHVRPDAWQLTLPRAGTRDALTVRFERPLDHALAARCLAVLRDGPAGALDPYPGIGHVAGDGRAWQFLPAAPWGETPCRVRVSSLLEDLAGNSVGRVFDRDLSRPGDDPVPGAFVDRPFVPRPAA